jgi:hypothetical protein
VLRERRENADCSSQGLRRTVERAQKDDPESSELRRAESFVRGPRKTVGVALSRAGWS